MKQPFSYQTNESHIGTFHMFANIGNGHFHMFEIFRFQNMSYMLAKFICLQTYETAISYV